MNDLSPVVFADLDDTLFQTARKMSETPCETRLASRAANGSHSYMTKAQAATVRWLLETTVLIPTTARSSKVLGRTTIPFRGYKICSNGGAIITPEGEHDPDWVVRVARISTDYSAAFAAMEAALAPLSKAGTLRSWLVCEAQTPVYLVAKIGADTPSTVLNDAEELCRNEVGDALVFHRSDRNMSFTPQGLTKFDAVKEMLERLPDTDRRPIWGMGDSVSDLPFMRLCQMMVAPSSSQITHTRLEA